jgi:hypothetical protein
MKQNKSSGRVWSVPKLSLAKAAERIQDFERGSLTERLAGLEALFEKADRKRAAGFCETQKLDSSLLHAALELKKVAGQVNVLIHAAGILMALPSILRRSETVQTLSLGAGNTGRRFDLETNRRIAEFKFIHWRGGSESIRQNSLFKDFYYLAEARSRKVRYLYLLELERPLQFLHGGRSLASVMSRNTKFAREFRHRYGNRFRVVREYYKYRRSRVELVDLSPILQGLSFEAGQ